MDCLETCLSGLNVLLVALGAAVGVIGSLATMMVRKSTAARREK